jgi:hypothetical protein
MCAAGRLILEANDVQLFVRRIRRELPREDRDEAEEANQREPGPEAAR